MTNLLDVNLHEFSAMVATTLAFSTPGVLSRSISSTTTAMSNSIYSAVSAPPGTSPKETQNLVTPLNEASTVLIVGATRGIGLEFAKQLKNKGCTIIGTCRDTNNENLKELGVHIVKMDVADETSIKTAASDVDKMNLPPITHVIHNAGVYGKRIPLDQVKSTDMQDVFKINTIGPFLVAQQFARLLSPPTSTRMPIIGILTSKVGSVDDNGSGGSYAYRASKSALNNVAKSLSIDMQNEVKVVLLHPGYVRTDMTGGNGLIDVDESVSGMLKAIEATGPDTPFRFVDFKACLIPW